MCVFHTGNVFPTHARRSAMARISSGLSRAKKSASTSRREDDLLGGGVAPGKEDEEVRRRVRVAFCVSTTSLVESNEHHVFPIIMYVYARVRSARVAEVVRVGTRDSVPFSTSQHTPRIPDGVALVEATVDVRSTYNVCIDKYRLPVATTRIRLFDARSCDIDRPSLRDMKRPRYLLLPLRRRCGVSYCSCTHQYSVLSTAAGILPVQCTEQYMFVSLCDICTIHTCMNTWTDGCRV